MNDFEKQEAIIALQGMMAAANAPSFEDIEKQHLKLVRELVGYSREKSMCLVAGISTLPQFHAHTIRVELLQHLIHRNAAGLATPKRNRIDQWLNNHLLSGWASQMEDPVEDVFISNVVTSIGNSRIFEGIWEGNDYCLQSALDALNRLRKRPWVKDILEKCFSLLSLSEALVDRCHLPRFCMGGGLVRSRIDLPKQTRLEQIADYPRFSHQELRELHIPLNHLQPFIHPEEQAKGSMGDSSLENCPLIKYADGVLVAIPSAISPAIRRFIVSSIVENNAVDDFERALCEKQGSILFNEGISALDASLVESSFLPSLPPNTPAMYQQLVKFDRGKFAHILYLKESVADLLETGLGGALNLGEDGASKLIMHSKKCAEVVDARVGTRGGLTIAVFGGLGRGFIFGANELPNGWYASAFHLHDFIGLGRIRRMDLLGLWRLLDQERELSRRSARIMNFNGELNLLAFWRQNGERLIPQHVPSTGAMVHMATDFIADLRKDARNSHDLHAVLRRNPDVWVSVSRYHTDTFFRELEDDNVYVDNTAVIFGTLRGVIESPSRGWWVSSIRKEESRWRRSIQWRLWYALLSWMARIAPLAESSIRKLPLGPIEIFLEIRDLDRWDSQRLEDLPSAQKPTFVTDRATATVKISLPLGFLRRFSSPVNAAERELIKTCFMGIAELGGTPTEQSLVHDLVQQVVRNDEARFFHLATAGNARQQLRSPSGHKLSFVKDGEVNFVFIGLSQRVLERLEEKEPIEGVQRCNRFLHAVVDDCWENIRTKLGSLDRESVIFRALENVEIIESDKEKWRLTSSALLAIHADGNEVTQAAQKRDNSRSGAEISSRVIIEMAVCTCPVNGSILISESDFDELQALVGVLNYAASICDAIEFGLTAPRVNVSPNGEFGVDEEYKDKIISPYVTMNFAGQFAAAADSYSDYFPDFEENREESKAANFPSAFVEAFQAEYGITPENLIHAQLIIAKEALSEGFTVVKRTKSDLLSTLRAAELGEDVLDCLITHFSLWPRGDWDKTPYGFNAKDWYPWRFRRRLSFIARPFVVLNEGGDSSVIFAPGFLHDAFEILFMRLLTGRLPAADFISAEMKSWIGEITRERGDEFEEEVADELRKGGYEARVGCEMRELGADKSYGNLDVIAWIPDGETFYLIECKRLQFARTTAEIGEQLKHFKGVEMDRLGRHVRRCEWIDANRESIERATKTKCVNPKTVPLLVTSTLVPMQFTKELPLPPERIIPLTDLIERIKKIASSAKSVGETGN